MGRVRVWGGGRVVRVGMGDTFYNHNNKKNMHSFHHSNDNIYSSHYFGYNKNQKNERTNLYDVSRG